MKAFNPHIRFLNVGRDLGVDPEKYALAAANGQKIQQARAQTASNVVAATAALSNQTGGNTLGFTYE